MEMGITGGVGRAFGAGEPPPSAGGGASEALAERLSRRQTLALNGAVAAGLGISLLLPERADAGGNFEPVAVVPTTYFGGNVSDFSESEGGIRVLELREGQGESCCAEGAEALVEWSIRLRNGLTIDASAGFPRRSGEADMAGTPGPALRFAARPLVYGIRGVGMRSDIIEAVREGVLGMRPNGVRRILTLPKLGWRYADQQPMPADEDRRSMLVDNKLSVLFIEVKLVGVQPPPVDT
mmetsp:Transcript_104399/g.300198  ORF Transcript_104399/g.300198 Transcript_104399/m.300198 type:complete len:238 (+) Transcript_104399:2-715(+)